MQILGIAVAVFATPTFQAGPPPDRDPGRRDTGDAGYPQHLPHTHDSILYGNVSNARPPRVSFAEASATARTGDVWLFRGRSVADHAIRVATNSPVNHVGMVVAIDDLPPLLWHAELGRSIPDVWSGVSHRGTQLHRLADAVGQWHHRYGQDAWMRQIDTDVTIEMEDELVRTIADLDGKSFPNTRAMATGWMKGRVRRRSALEHLFCAEVVAISYQRMGLLGEERPPNWYDPGNFWSGDNLELRGASLSDEIVVDQIPPYVPRD